MKSQNFLGKETLAWTALIVSLSFLVFLAYRNITGFVISSANYTQSYLSLLAFLVILITTFYLIHINKKKYK